MARSDPSHGEPASRRAPGLGLATRAVLLVTGLCLSLVVAELVLRWREPDAWRVWPANLRRTFTPDPLVIAGVESPSHFSTNAQGMRGDPWNEAARHHILAVGGSTTICVYLDDSSAWPHRVQDLLDRAEGPDFAWVGNVGRPGHTTQQNLLQLGKLLQQYPRIDTVVMMVGANDFLIQLALQRLRSSQPDAAAKALFAKPDPADELRRAFSDVPPPSDGPWYRRSALLRAILSLRRPRSIGESLPFLDDSGRFFAEARKFRRQSSQWLDTLPDLTAAHRQFAVNLQRIADLARASGVRLILVTQPSLWSPDLSAREMELLWTGGPPVDRLRPGEAYYSTAALAEGMNAYNEVLLGICLRRRIECIDAARQLPRTSEIFYDDVHLTDAGSRRLAELVGGYLLEAKARGWSAGAEKGR
jgi:hypothetical protein